MVRWKFWKREEEPAVAPLPEEQIYRKWYLEMMWQVVPAVILIFALYGYAIWLLLVRLPIIWALQVAAPVFCIYFIIYLKVKEHYVKKYSQNRITKQTIYRTTTDRFTDYFSIAKIERIDYDDVRAVEAREVLNQLRKLRLRLAELTPPNPSTHIGHDDASTTMPQTDELAVSAEFEEVMLPCPVCGFDNTGVGATYCSECGQMIEPDEYFFEVTYAFRTDEWQKVLIVSDVDIEQHWNEVPDTAYVGAIGIRAPVSQVSLVKIGTGVEGIPILQFVESKENVARIQNLEQLTMSSPDRALRAAEGHDWWLSIELSHIVEDMARDIRSLENARQYQLERGGKEAERLYQIRKRYGEEPRWKLSKRTAIVILSVITAACLVVFFLWLINFILIPLILGPPPTQTLYLALQGAGSGYSPFGPNGCILPPRAPLNPPVIP